MASALEPMTPDQRARFRQDYLTYLRARDGVPDFTTRRFDVRERFFQEVDAAPQRWVGPLPVDQATFNHHHLRHDPSLSLTPALLWALATAKTNRAEAFGVELSIEADTKTAAQRLEDPHAYIQIEEFYHTRILRDVLATIGLDVEVAVPTRKTQILVQAMVYLPASASDVLVFCGEIVGVTIFSLLLAKARELFSHQPDAMARIESLFAQILVDEVGHVQFLRSRLSPFQIGLARRALPIVVANVVADIPELALLFGRDALMEHAMRADVDAASASYPDRLVVAA